MLKHILAAAVATALIAAPLTPAFAQAATEKVTAQVSLVILSRL